MDIIAKILTRLSVKDIVYVFVNEILEANEPTRAKLKVAVKMLSPGNIIVIYPRRADNKTFDNKIREILVNPKILIIDFDYDPRTDTITIHDVEERILQ